MNPSLPLLAAVIARPRGRRPRCVASSWPLALGASDGFRATCPRCGRTGVHVDRLFPHAVVLGVHREAVVR